MGNKGEAELDSHKSLCRAFEIPLAREAAGSRNLLCFANASAFWTSPSLFWKLIKEWIQGVLASLLFQPFIFFMKAEKGDGQASVLKVKGPKDTGTDGPRPAGSWGELPRVVLNFAC